MLNGEMKTFLPPAACRSEKPRSFCAVTTRVCVIGATSELHFTGTSAAPAEQPHARNARATVKLAATALRITSKLDSVLVRIRNVDRLPVSTRSEDLDRALVDRGLHRPRPRDDLVDVALDDQAKMIQVRAGLCCRTRLHLRRK